MTWSKGFEISADFLANQNSRFKATCFCGLDARNKSLRLIQLNHTVDYGLVSRSSTIIKYIFNSFLFSKRSLHKKLLNIYLIEVDEYWSC